MLGTALLLGGLAAVAPAPSLVCGAVLAVVAWRRWRASAVCLLIAAFSSAWFRAHGALAAGEQRREVARLAVGVAPRCEGEAQIVSSPVWVHGGLRWDGEWSDIWCDGRKIPGTFRARFYGGEGDLARGDLVFVVAGVAPSQLLVNDDLPDPRPPATRQGNVLSGGIVDLRLLRSGRSLGAAIDRLRAIVRRSIVRDYPPLAAPFARALVLGEGDLDSEDDDAFRVSGLAHLLAVSGSHLVIAIGGWVRFVRWCLRRIEPLSRSRDVGAIASGIGVPSAWIFADFAGGSGSASRAAAMLSIALAVRALGGRASAKRAFAWSLIAFALADPLVGFDLSFTLSLAATFGLLAIRPVILGWLPSARPGAPRTLKLVWVGPLATSVAASLPCAPLVARIAPTLPLGGLLANLVAVPLGELVALPICLAQAITAPLPWVHQGCAAVASGALLAMRAVARLTASFPPFAPAVPPPTAAQWVLVAILTMVWREIPQRRRTSFLLSGMAGVLLLEAFAYHASHRQGRLRVTTMDIGQGDASLVDFPDGGSLLIDGGGMVGSPLDLGSAVVLPVLRARRCSRLVAAILSHPHPDHFLGLVTALPKLQTAEFWDTGQGEREGAGASYASLLRHVRDAGVPIRRPGELCGERSIGGARVEILAPCPGLVPSSPPNDNSFVLRISWRGKSVLFVGDAERAEELAIVNRWGGALQSDLLKVGHHGSRTSTGPLLLDAVRPRDAFISSGIRNRFGHPSPVTLDLLSARGIRVWRTDLQGGLVWETDGANVQVKSAKKASVAEGMPGSVTAWTFF